MDPRGSPPGVRMRVTDAVFERDYTAIRGVRFAVFVDEQRIDPDLEMDDRDAHCEHVLAWNARDEVVGTGRIDFAAGGKVGRVAVLASERGSGVGTALMGGRAASQQCGATRRSRRCRSTSASDIAS